MAKIESASGLDRRKLLDIKKKKISAEQIDDLMDATERRLTKKRASRQSRISSDSNHTDSNDIATYSDDPKIPTQTFFTALDLLGRVIRNSEFTDASQKQDSARLYLHSCIKVLLAILHVLEEVMDELVKRRQSRSEDRLSADEINGIRYILIKSVIIGLTANISDTFGTEKLFMIYENLMSSKDTTIGEKIILSFVLLDLQHSRWQHYWEELIRSAPRRRLVLDLLTDKIWQLIHTRPLPDAERDKLAVITVQIEERFGRPTSAKSRIIAQVRKSAAATTRREG